VDSQVRAITQLFDIKNGRIRESAEVPHWSAIDLVLSDISGRKSGICWRWRDYAGKMARGGVYDQLAGGFHRYSVGRTMACAALPRR